MTTTTRPGRYETTDYLAMLSRMIRGLGRRLGDGDPADIAGAVALQRELDAVIRAGVLTMREDHGFSWAQIADELGVTRQAAYQRYGMSR
jgi:hypothetical protein